MKPMQSRTWLMTALVCLVANLVACDSFKSPTERLERARQSIAAGESGVAAIDLRKVIASEPQNAEARLLLAELWMRGGDPRSAQGELDQLMSMGAMTPRAAELAGEARLALGSAGELLRLLDSGKLSPDEPAKSVLHARALRMLGRKEEAEAELKRVLETHPSSPMARVALAEVLAADGRSEDALALLTDVTGDPAAWLLRAQILSRRGQFSAAESALSQARALPTSRFSLPQRAMMLTSLGDVQLVRGKVSEAEATQKELAAIAPAAPATQLLLARLQLSKGQYISAIGELQRIVNAVPDLLRARMMLGAAHLAQGNLLQAESQLAKVVDRAPDNIEARKLLARVRLQLNQPEAAIRVLTPALEQSPEDAQVLSMIGDAHLRAHEPDSGIEALEKSVRLHPGEEQLQLALASAYIFVGRYPKAIELLQSMPRSKDSRRERLLLGAIAAGKGPAVARTELERLVAEQPDNVDMRQLAAMYYLSQREPDRARKHLHAILEAKPADMRALIGLGRVELLAGNQSGAEDAFKRAARGNPQEPAPQLVLAQLYLTRNDAAHARSALDAAVAASAAPADVLNAAGLLLMSAQRYDEALERFRRATEIDAGNAMAWLNTGRAQLARDRSADARQSIEKALAIQPNLVAAANALVLIDLRTSGPAVALARVQELRRQHPDDASVMTLEGDVHMAAGEYREAARAYREAERVHPTQIVVLRASEALRRAGMDKPEAPLTRWLSLHSDDSTIRAALAQYYTAAHQVAAAATQLEMLDKQRPGNPVVLNNLAWVYHESGDERAEATARRAYELAPKNPSVADTYGWILLQKEKTAMALPLLEGAAGAAQEDPDVQYHYGAALAAAGRKTEARQVLTRTLASGREFASRHDVEKLLADLGT